jgi:hypothetical protein
MRTVNITKLKRVGSGAFSTVYRLSSKRVVKVYNKSDSQHDGNIMAEEIELSMCSQYALPVLEAVVAKKIMKSGVKYYYAVIKEYMPHRATWREVDRLTSRLPRKLQDDCYYDNVRKDNKGNIFLIDTQGDYAFDTL